MCVLLQIANVSSGAGSLAGKVSFLEDEEYRKTIPYDTQAMDSTFVSTISHPPQRAGCCRLKVLCAGPAKLQEHVQTHMEDATRFMLSAMHSCTKQVCDVQRPSHWQLI